MQYTKLDTTIPTKPKYSTLSVTAMPAQVQWVGFCAVIPYIMVEIRIATRGMIVAMSRYSGWEVS